MVININMIMIMNRDRMTGSTVLIVCSASDSVLKSLSISLASLLATWGCPESERFEQHGLRVDHLR